LAIERVDGGVIHHGDADATGGRTVVLEYRAGGTDEPITIDGHAGLLIGDFDFDHGEWTIHGAWPPRRPTIRRREIGRYRPGQAPRFHHCGERQVAACG
jgi:hypothetical protein